MTDQLVWLASYPKSGNTWVRAILTALLNEPDAALDINAMVGTAGLIEPDVFEDIMGVAWSEISSAQRKDLLPIFTAELAREAKGTEVRKTHLSFGHTGPGVPVFSNAAGAAAIYVLRDPRQVAVSHARFFGTDIQTAIETMRNPERQVQMVRPEVVEHLGTWSDHVMGWISQDHLPTHVIHYEKLLADPIGEVTAMMTFLNLPVAPSRIHAACTATAFPQLQAQERATGFRGGSLSSKVFFREGTVDEWRHVLTPDQRAQIERDHACAMALLCYG